LKRLLYILLFLSICLYGHTQSSNKNFIFYYLENPSVSVDKNLLKSFFELQNVSKDIFHLIIINPSYIISLLDQDLIGFHVNQKDSIINLLINQISNQNEFINHEKLKTRSILLSISSFFESQINLSFLNDQLISNESYKFSFIIDTDDFAKFYNERSKFFNTINSFKLVSLVNTKNLNSKLFISKKHVSFKSSEFSKYTTIQLIKI
jgi:hypothetical protein